MPAIETRDLTKRYGRSVTAVDELNLTVETGEIFGFLGPNGAGKSTTIDVLLDYARPTSGSASVLGLDSRAGRREIHRRVGILPDGYGLYDRLTGREHLAYAIDLKGADDDPDALLDRVGLSEEAAARAAGGYSRGMAQRLALGMALVGDPDLLILDEPSTGLDPNGVRLVREVAREHASAGGTVFFSSHVLSQVEAVCDRVAILDDGRLVAVDTIDSLREELGTGSTLRLSVDRVPDGLGLADLPGVSSVTTDGGAITATCSEPEAKLAVLDSVREAGVTVADFSTAQASLEDLFAAYTGETTAVSGESSAGPEAGDR